MHITSALFVPKLNAPDANHVQNVIALLTQVLNTHKAKVLQAHNEIQPDTLIVAVGGDGTMLEAMRMSSTRGGVAVGVNLGNVGFLTELSYESVDQLWSTFEHMVLGKNCHVDHLATIVSSANNKAIACNEITIAPTYSDEMIRYVMHVDGKYAGEHRANSVMVSTPSGSSAYSLSAGGAIMMPMVEALQITAVAPMNLTSRPIVIPLNSVVTFTVSAKGCNIRADGTLAYRTTSSEPHTIEIRTSAPARVLRTNTYNHFQTLSNKLGWHMK